MDFYGYSSIDELKTKYVIFGSIIHSLSIENLQIIKDGMIIYTAYGIIERVINLENRVINKKDCANKFKLVYDYTGKLIIPGFIDAHCHAPQYVFAGIGMDLQLLDWLNTYTYPSEAKFSDVGYARITFDKAVKRHLKNGTTFASYFGTIHCETGT